MDRLSALKAKSNPVICALNFIPFSYSEHWSDNSNFFSCIITVTSLLLEHFHQHKICFYFFNLQQQHQCSSDLITSRCRPISLLFSVARFLEKAVCTCCFQCILLFFSLNFCTSHCSESPLLQVFSVAKTQLQFLGPFLICLITSI